MKTGLIQVKVAAKEQELKTSLEQFVSSVDGFVVQDSNDARRSDMMIFELGENAEKDFSIMQSLKDLNKVDEFFLVSNTLDQSVLLDAIRVGVKEVFPLPLDKEKFREALGRFAEKKEKKDNHQSRQIGKIVNVLGSKGGIGTTTIAVNLAVSLAETEASPSVALLDRNHFFGEVPLFLEIDSQHHLGEIAKNINRLDTTFLTSVLSKHESGVYVLPSQPSLNGYPTLTPDIMVQLLNLMQRMFDYVVIDGGRYVDQNALKIIEMSDTVLLVSNLCLPSISNTRKMLETMQSLQYPVDERVRVVVNRHTGRTDITLEEAEKTLTRKVFWTIPNDYRRALSAINQGKPLSQLAASASITKSMKGLAESLVPGSSEKRERWGFLKMRW